MVESKLNLTISELRKTLRDFATGAAMRTSPLSIMRARH